MWSELFFVPSYAGADELSAGKYSYLISKTVGLMHSIADSSLFPTSMYLLWNF